MTKIQKIEQEVAKLTPQELVTFRDWFRKYDDDEWDRQIEGDVRAGRLDLLAKKAILDHKEGRSKAL